MDPQFDEDVDVWPGFVDVLASVVLFLLLGFVTVILAQDFKEDDARAYDDRRAAEVGDRVLVDFNGALLKTARARDSLAAADIRPDDCVRDGWIVTCTFREMLRFGTARWTVEGDGLKVLDGFARELRSLCADGAVKRVVVEGHTDPVSMGDGTGFMTNWELSSARAGHVVRYLQNNAGIPGELLEAVGRAEMSPPGGNREAPHERWRRVAIRVHLNGSILDQKHGMQ